MNSGIFLDKKCNGCRVRCIYIAVLEKLVSSKYRSMKKTFMILAAALAVATGCSKNGSELGKDGFIIEKSAHTITINTDSPVEAFWASSSDKPETIEGTLSEDGKAIECSGEWYSAKVNIEGKKEIVITVDENTTGNERDLILSAYYMGKSGRMVITQKSR